MASASRGRADALATAASPRASSWRRGSLLIPPAGATSAATFPPNVRSRSPPSVAQAYDRRAQNAPWCPGTYRLAVKRVDKLRKRPSSPIGTVTFTVGRTTARDGEPRRPSHGVSEASIDEGISETPYRQVVDRYGRPKSVPPEYRMVGGRACIYYDILGPGADTPAFIVTPFRLCFQGKVDSASGGSFVLLPPPPRARAGR